MKQLTSKVFLKIHQNILEKFYKQFPESQNFADYQKYGYSQYNVDRPNLKAAFTAEYEIVKNKYIPENYFKGKLNGKYLRDMYKSVEDNGDTSKTVSINPNYLEVYLTYLHEENLFSFIQKLITNGEIQPQEVQEQYNLLDAAQSNVLVPKEMVYYRCFHKNHNKELKDFIIELDFSNGNATIPLSPEDLKYKGSFDYSNIKTDNQFLLLRTTNTDRVSREAHIILFKGQGSLKNRKITFGSYSNVTDSSRPYCNLILFVKLEHKDAIIAKTHKKLINKYFKEENNLINDTSVSNFDEFELYLNKTYGSWQEDEDFAKNITGLYQLYAIDTKSNMIEELIFEINKHQEVKCKCLPFSRYEGTLRITNGSVAILELSKIGKNTIFNILLKLPDGDHSPKQMEGVYLFISKSFFPRAGRCVFKKIEEDVRYKDLEPRQIAAKTNPYNQEEWDKVFLEQLKNFFYGNEFGSNDRENTFIENKDIFKEENILRFPKSEKVKSWAGTYLYGRKSSFKADMIKVYPIKIDHEGYVTIKDRDEFGRLIVAKRGVFLHTFKKYSKNQDYFSSTAFNKNPNKNGLYEGLYTSINREGRPSSVESILIRCNESEKFEDLDYNSFYPNEEKNLQGNIKSIIEYLRNTPIKKS